MLASRYNACVYRHGMHVSRSFTTRRAWDRNNYVTIINSGHRSCDSSRLSYIFCRKKKFLPTSISELLNSRKADGETYMCEKFDRVHDRDVGFGSLIASLKIKFRRIELRNRVHPSSRR